MFPRPTNSGFRSKLRERPRRAVASYGSCSLFLFVFVSAYSALPAQQNSLIEKNPFLPPGYGEPEEVAPTPPPAQTNGPISREIEFRGVIQMGGDYQFSLFNKSEQKGYWIQENESQDGLSVRGFDPDSMSVTVNLRGRAERLTLMSSSDSPLPVQASASPQQKPNLPPQVQQAQQGGNSDERRRVIPRRRVILPRN